jgi:hypothetical protein
MCCHLVGCGTPSEMQSAAPLDMRSIVALHMMVFCVYDSAGNMIDTMGTGGDFKECKCSAALLIPAVA